MATTEQRSEMQRHLDGGCRECRQAVRFWMHVTAAASHEKQYAPPASALRLVSGQFGLQRPGRRSVGEAMKLAFDSLLHPFHAGISSSGTSARHLLYRSGNYSVDLRVALQAATGQIDMVGQVLNSGDPDRGISDIPVYLQCDDGSWRGVTTNPLGEFHFECPPSDSLRLSFGVNPKRTLVISIPMTQDVPSPNVRPTST
jgi:hypothetical protein